jgi:flagellar hook assembly protein FlgD
MITVSVPPATTHLKQNVPNPFNPTTAIRYSLSTPGRVQLAIYGIDGALVRRLDPGEQSAGHHTAYWNGYDAVGRPVTSGVYFYRLEGAVTTPARRMVLLR